jgi:drug/metabolite transporter (DMT)-like permease
MSVTVGIITGLTSMFSWGIADFFVAMATRKIGNFRALFWMLIVSLASASVYLLAETPNWQIPLQMLFLIALVGFLQVLAMLSFYQGLAVGLVSVVSPIASSYTWIVVLLSMLFLKEKLTNIQLLGILLILVGIPAISLNLEEIRYSQGNILQKGVKEGLLTMLGWGISYTMLIPAVRQLGWFLPVFLFHFFAIVSLFLYGELTKKSFKMDNLSMLPALICIGVLSMVGFLASGFGFQYSLASVVAPIAATFPMVTILLARIFFKEKLFWNQALGIAGVISGLILLSI